MSSLIKRQKKKDRCIESNNRHAQLIHMSAGGIKQNGEKGKHEPPVMEGRIDDDLLRTGRIDGVRQLIRVKRPMNC